MGDRRRDPVVRRDDGSQDLYEIADWEVRSTLDHVVYRLYYGTLSLGRLAVVLAALAILGLQFVVTGLGAITDPALGAFTILSILPALLLAGYVWRADVTESEPMGMLVATFLLGMLFSGFAGILNVYVGDAVKAIGSGFVVPAVGTVLSFYVVVGPVEETVKLLAVRMLPYRGDQFDGVIDGAVYGAMAGLGFATIENALYITGAIGGAAAESATATGTSSTVALRTLAGPGHVIYTAYAGYYLGLAKFAPEHRGPIVLKGLLIVAVVHATYNTLVGIVPGFLEVVAGLDPLTAFVAFVVVYDGTMGYFLIRKLGAYRRAYLGAQGGAVAD